MFYYSQKKKKKQENGAVECFRLFLKIILDDIICLYLMLMLVVFPLYNEEGYAHIGTDKAVFLCRLSTQTGKFLAIPLILYLILCLVPSMGKEGKKIFRSEARGKYITLTDAFALLYAVSLVLSYACSPYKESALWGAGAWYMGLVPQLMFVCIYFLVSRLWNPRSWLFLMVLPVSAVVFLLGCLNRFGIYPIQMEYASAEFISTIGNINWYCGYAVSVAFIGIVLYWLKAEMKSWQRLLLAAYVGLSFLSLVIQGSDSGLAALAVVLLSLFCLSVRDRQRMLAFWQEMVLLWGGCLAVFFVRLLAPGKMNYVGGLTDKLTYGWFPVVMTIVSVLALAWVRRSNGRGIYPERVFSVTARAVVFGCIAAVLLILLLAVVNTLRPGSIGMLSGYSWFTLNEQWGSSRGATWSAGWRCFSEQDALHKLVGTGPDCMWEYIRTGASESLKSAVTEKFGESNRLTNAHNEWLTILVNMGILGLAGYGGMMVCGIRELIKKGRNVPAACACGFCLLAYTVNNMFSFQQAMSTGSIFVIFGMGKAFLRRGSRER